MEHPARMLVLADIRLHREGVAAILRRQDDVEVVACAATAQEAAAKIADIRPHAILVDSRMRGSTAAVREIVEAHPAATVLALGVDGVEDDIVRHAEAGVAGYVGSDADAPEVVDAVQRVGRGEMPCSPGVAAALLRRVLELASRPENGLNLRLTSRQLEIARLIARGLANKEIASALFIEVATVKGHVHAILERLQLRRREEIAAVLRHGPVVHLAAEVRAMDTRSLPDGHA